MFLVGGRGHGGGPGRPMGRDHGLIRDGNGRDAGIGARRHWHPGSSRRIERGLLLMLLLTFWAGGTIPSRGGGSSIRSSGRVSGRGDVASRTLLLFPLDPLEVRVGLKVCGLWLT